MRSPTLLAGLFLLAFVACGDASTGGRSPTSPASALASPQLPGLTCAYGGLRPLAFVGDKSAGLLLADVDGDGSIDAVVARPAAHAIVVARGRGDGTFFDGVALPLEGVPRTIALGDVDGFPDVVVAEDQPPRVTVLTAGSGGLRVRTRTPLPWVSTKRPVLGVGDLDGDGRADVVLGDLGSPTVSVLRATGGGALSAPAPVFVDQEAITGIAVGDFDGNHTTDIAVAARASITVLAGVGGAFTPHEHDLVDGPFDLVPYPHAGKVGFAVALENGDVRVVGLGLAQAMVIRGDGRNRRSSATAVADLDRDGTPDIVDLTTSRNVLTVARVDRNKLVAVRSAAPPRHPVDLDEGDEPSIMDVTRDLAELPGGNTPSALAVADLDGDRALDIVSVDDEGWLGATMNRGDGTFGPALVFPFGASVQGASIADVDADRDGDVVVIASDATGSDATAFLRRGPGVVAVRTPLSGLHADFAAFDTDGDGRPDLVSLVDDSSLAVQIGSGDGRFGPARAFPLAPKTVIARFADVDGDGAVDAVLGTHAGVFVARNLRSAGFAPPFSLGLADASIDSISIEDLDGDGRLDILASESGYSRSANVFWSALPGAPTKLAPARLAVAGRLGRRPLPDVVSLDSTPTVYANDGRRAFHPLPDPRTKLPAARIVIDDIDGDGRGDILYGDGGDLVLLRGRDDGSLSAMVRYRLRSSYETRTPRVGDAKIELTEMRSLAILRGSRGQPPALVVTTNGTFFLLPRNCWKAKSP